jgi:hypothetical protein
MTGSHFSGQHLVGRRQKAWFLPAAPARRAPIVDLASALPPRNPRLRLILPAAKSVVFAAISLGVSS